MRLDTLGTPPLLQVVAQPKTQPTGGAGVSDALVKQVLETSPQSSSSNSGNKERLAVILDIINKGQKDKPKKKEAYKKMALKTYSSVATLGQTIEESRPGSSLDTKA